MIAVRRQIPGGTEGFYLLFIGFSVSQLLFDIRNGAVAALLKPGRQLSGTLFAQISVVQLSVSQKTYFFSADVTIFFIKKSHS